MLNLMQPTPPIQSTTMTYAVETWQHLRWHKNTRYYDAQLHQDLWGNWVLTCTWGRRNSKLSQVRHTPCETYQQGFGLLQATIKRREQRGYTRVAS